MNYNPLNFSNIFFCLIIFSSATRKISKYTHQNLQLLHKTSQMGEMGYE